MSKDITFQPDMSLSDYELGCDVINAWIAFQAQTRGLDPYRLDPRIVDEIVSMTASERFATHNYDDFIDFGVIRLAAQEKYAEAGALYRSMITARAKAINTEKLARIGRNTRDVQRERAKAGGAELKSRAQERRKVWQAVGQPIRTKHPDWSNQQLAACIAKKCNDSANTIRQAIPGLGLGKPRK